MLLRWESEADKCFCASKKTSQLTSELKAKEVQTRHVGFPSSAPNSYVQICIMPHYNQLTNPYSYFFHKQFHLLLYCQGVLKQLSKIKNIFQPPIYKY